MSITVRPLNHLKASLNYATGAPRSKGALVPIYDGRPLLKQLSLDREGFVLRRHATAVANFYDAEEVRSIYYPEVEHLLKEVTGAARAVAFEHDVRCAPEARADRPGAREAVRVVHDDYTETSAPGRIRLYLPDEADALLQHRFAVINVWRAIRGPVRATPLAVCDAQSLIEQDLVPITEGVKHEVYLFNFSPRHRWFYFPAMETDEALILKCFDSITDGRARFTAHTAFDDPTTPPDAPDRESIEVRALVFFAPTA
jgi:hypothetical protein